ncbi:elongation factor P maturation arginine rhamnosyltransferase EarP [Rhodoferax ferrireducens]|uniref:elongation factor P maturation arginine rhamnosyltransferase EarP n=1 Tax=Rhodoferax ferrireducens TaxID=192843 RepID=UPI003B3A5424
MNTGNSKLWDIFCRVIDNYGDIGVCWRLAIGLAERGEQVRLWVDDASALGWMAPEGAQGVELRPWTQPIQTDDLVIGDVLIEAFGCEIAPEYIASYADSTRARGLKSIWINLEYLSAEDFAERSHGLPSPVMSGPGTGLTKHFFYPGFTSRTGGLLREPDLAERQAQFDRIVWLRQLGIEFRGERLVSLFCYEPPALSELLDQLAINPHETRLMVTAGRAAAAVKACIDDKNKSQPLWNMRKQLSFSYVPMLSQREFDHLLWACDLNFVRGEDSLVRALWADKPFVWQIYPQHDDAHHDKLDAFLNVMSAPLSLRDFHHVWNGVQGFAHANLPAMALPEWQVTVTQARKQQLQHDDLVTQLMRFVLKNH